jgi:phage N-6-adenine-methyltransferase
VDRLIKQEACQLYIEQEIATGLAEGKTPYAIGKNVAEWVQKLFEAKITPHCIEQRAHKQKTKILSTESNGQIVQPESESEENQEFKWGGKREGAGRPPKFKVIEPAHRTSFTGENEWYTPIQYIEAARKVMSRIDLDPATSEFGQQRIQANIYHTKETNGLKATWIGKVWLNPPYSQPLIAQFIEKTVSQYKAQNITEAIILTHNYTDTEWFHSLESVANLLCFTKGRIKYEKEDGTVAAPTQGACFFYLGKNVKRFKEVFKEFGFIR